MWNRNRLPERAVELVGIKNQGLTEFPVPGIQNILRENPDTRLKLNCMFTVEPKTRDSHLVVCDPGLDMLRYADRAEGVGARLVDSDHLVPLFLLCTDFTEALP